MNQKTTTNVLLATIVILFGVIVYISLSNKTSQTSSQVPTINTGGQTITNLPATQPPSSPSPSVTPIPTNSNPTSDTINWKTYTNSRFSYSIKYPSTWSPQVQAESSQNSQVIIKGSDGNITIFVNGDFGGGPCSMVGKLTQISTTAGQFMGCVTTNGIRTSGDSSFLNHGSNEYTLQASWTNASNKQEVMNALSTFKFTN